MDEDKQQKAQGTQRIRMSGKEEQVGSVTVNWGKVCSIPAEG